MSDENELDKLGGFILVSFLAPFFRHAGRGVFVAVVGCRRSVARGLFLSVLAPSSVLRGFLVLVLPHSALLALCASRAGFPPMPLSCLLAIRSVPYRRIARLPVRSTSGAGRMRFASRSGFVSTAVACCLPCLAVETAGRFSLVGVVHGRRVDGVGGRYDFRRPRCLSWVILSGRRCSLVSPSRSCLLALMTLVVVMGRHGLIVIWCCRSGPVSSSVIMARRRLVLLVLGVVVGRVRHVWVSSIVDRLAASRSLAPSYLSGGGATCGACSLP